MRLAFSLLAFFVCYMVVIATADLASSNDLPSYYFNPYLDFIPQEVRAVGTSVGGLNLPLQRATSIIISTFTCTLSVSNRCRASVARPGLFGILRPGRPAVITTKEFDESDHHVEDTIEERFPIAPSAVQGVEATPLPIRDTLAAYPQGFVKLPVLRDQAEYILSAFESEPHESAMSLPFYRRFTSHGQQQRQIPMLAFFLSLFATKTITTSFKIATFTSTPSCSVTGTLPQCPNGK